MSASGVSVAIPAYHRWGGMALCVSGCELFLRVGGFDPCISRMEDIELGYRRYHAGTTRNAPRASRGGGNV